MSVAAISSAPSLPPAVSTAAPARAADGDYKTANAKSVRTMDNDGDYKAIRSSAASQSAPAVQASLNSLKAGG